MTKTDKVKDTYFDLFIGKLPLLSLEAKKLFLARKPKDCEMIKTSKTGFQLFNKKVCLTEN